MSTKPASVGLHSSTVGYSRRWGARRRAGASGPERAAGSAPAPQPHVHGPLRKPGARVSACVGLGRAAGGPRGAGGRGSGASGPSGRRGGSLAATELRTAGRGAGTAARGGRPADARRSPQARLGARPRPAGFRMAAPRKARGAVCPPDEQVAREGRGAPLRARAAVVRARQACVGTRPVSRRCPCRWPPGRPAVSFPSPPRRRAAEQAAFRRAGCGAVRSGNGGGGTARTECPPLLRALREARRRGSTDGPGHGQGPRRGQCSRRCWGEAGGPRE